MRNVLRFATIGVISRRRKRAVCFSATANFVGSGVLGDRRRYVDEGKTPARTAFRNVAHALRRSSVHRGIRLARIGWDSVAYSSARHGRRVHALCARAPAFSPASQRTPIRTNQAEPPPHAAVPRARRSDDAIYFVGADGVPVAAVCQGKQYRIH